MVADLVGRPIDSLFNGVQRSCKTPAFMDQKRDPDGHSFNFVVLKLGAFLKEESDVVDKRAGGENGVARLCKSVEAEELGRFLPLLESFKNRWRHFSEFRLSDSRFFSS